MLFHPAIKDIKRIIQSGEFGNITNFSYHSGQYLPDWHPWEKVSEYYVSNRETGGGREIVPFELTWIADVIGFPKKVTGFFGCRCRYWWYVRYQYGFWRMSRNTHRRRCFTFCNTIIDTQSWERPDSLELEWTPDQNLWCNQSAMDILQAPRRDFCDGI